jgi:hypothetical protein
VAEDDVENKKSPSSITAVAVTKTGSARRVKDDDGGEFWNAQFLKN